MNKIMVNHGIAIITNDNEEDDDYNSIIINDGDCSSSSNNPIKVPSMNIAQWNAPSTHT